MGDIGLGEVRERGHRKGLMGRGGQEVGRREGRSVYGSLG